MTTPEITLEQLPPRLREAAGRAHWTSLMPVQARALPYLLAGRDAMIQARTGSGKTGAFLLPILQRLDPARSNPPQGNPIKPAKRAKSAGATARAAKFFTRAHCAYQTQRFSFIPQEVLP